MRRVLVLACLLAFGAAVYTPGTPGADWTQDELRIARAKIYMIIKDPEAALEMIEGGSEILDVYRPLHRPNLKLNTKAIIPNLAKIVRLTFHDCLKEENGAGCNGCLNFDGMGNIYSKPACRNAREDNCTIIDNGTHPKQGPFQTDNNNLLWVGKVLEEVYKNATFRLEGYDDIEHFEVSLYESGKSRADLWAFAGMVSIQRSAEIYNFGCDASKPAPCFNQIDANSPPCGYTLPTPAFKTGRSDCVPSCTGKFSDIPFCTSEHEVHPSPTGNGKHVADFFSDQFRLNPKETIALMGAHTLGHPMESNSMIRHYPWTQRSTSLDNNYYVNIANTTNYKLKNPLVLPLLSDKKVKFKDCNYSVSAYMGDEYGNANRFGYRVRSERKTSTFGPWTWALFTHGCSRAICDSIKENGDYTMNSCCHYLDSCEGDKCSQNTKIFDCKDNVGTGCDQTFFQSISMISPDMGLHMKFDVDEDGRPVNCSGLDRQVWLENKQIFSNFVTCERNDIPAADEMSMADVVEMYAADNNAWIQDFVPVYNKMLENGVDPDNLHAMPSYDWFN